MNDEFAARLLLAAALVLGLASLPRIERDLDYETSRADVPAVAGIPAIVGMPDGMPELLALTRRRVPEDERITIVTHAGICRPLPIRGGQGAVFWTLYNVLPRAVTCDPRAPWRIYLGVRPAVAGVPPGARVFAVRPSLALVRL